VATHLAGRDALLRVRRCASRELKDSRILEWERQR
jgi:hypothetical protein